MITQYDKAIVAFLAALFSLMSARGLDLDPDLQATITTLATTLAVFLVPNKPKKEEA